VVPPPKQTFTVKVIFDPGPFVEDIKVTSERLQAIALAMPATAMAAHTSVLFILKNIG
jgi:hypothetical protein